MFVRALLDKIFESVGSVKLPFGVEVVITQSFEGQNRTTRQGKENGIRAAESGSGGAFPCRKEQGEGDSEEGLCSPGLAAGSGSGRKNVCCLKN